MRRSQQRLFAARIVLAYLTRNEISPTDELIALSLVEDEIQRIVDRSPVRQRTPSPAEIAASIRPDGLVSFIDGETRSTLRRHLAAHGLHPASYRERYGLPSYYPMVAPAYGVRRSEIAREIGLGGSLPNQQEKDRQAPGHPPQRGLARLTPSVEESSRSRASRPKEARRPDKGGSA